MSPLTWLQSGFHVVLALAFAILALVLAPRVGRAGAYALAAMAALDLFGIVFERVMWAVAWSSPLARVTRMLQLMNAVDLLLNLLSCALVLLAGALLRRTPA